MNPIRGIARRFTQATSRISGVSTPKVYLLSEWKMAERTVIFPQNCRFSKPLISDDLCFGIFRTSTSGNLLLEVPETYTVNHFFNVPKTFEISHSSQITDLDEEKSTPSDFSWNQPLGAPESFKIKFFTDDSFSIDSCDYTALLRSRVHCSCLVVEPFHSIETFEYAQAENLEVKTSKNLLALLTIPKVSGHLFEKTERPTQSTESPRTKTTTSKNGQSEKGANVWELLQPVLLPPLSLDFPKKLDFYDDLRGYQKQGISWLIVNPSALLADEMGTGKTVQTVTALRLLFRTGKIKNALIVCPPAVIGSITMTIETKKSEGWSGHFHHWAPELKVVTLHGKSPQERIQLWERAFHIYITTYSTLRTDFYIPSLSSRERFNCIILDEAQKIKNRETLTAKVVREFRPKYRWALTGTPIENKLDDVKSLFDFIRPGLFKRNEKDSSKTVRGAIEPYMLRRLKEDVLKDLPDKIKQEDWLDLDQDQKGNYEKTLKAVRRGIKDTLGSQASPKGSLHIFAKLQKLKMICNFAEGKKRSPKANLLLEYVKVIKSNNQKVLVFSQYKAEGTDKIYQLLQDEGIQTVLYTGTLSRQQKERAVKDFRSDSNITVFLATTRTAGYGITLTEATYVIHFDYLWNPAVMQNAEDRTHRIGQKSSVTVYSFWMKGTIEERIKKKILEKRLLIDSTVNELSVDLDEGFSTEDWLDILDIEVEETSISSKEKIKEITLDISQETENEADKATSFEKRKTAVPQSTRSNTEHRKMKNSRLQSLEENLALLREDIAGREKAKILAPFEEETRIDLQIKQRRKQMRPLEEEYWQLLIQQSNQGEVSESEAEIVVAEIVETTMKLQNISPYPTEIMDMLQKIYEEASAPGSPAAAKLKGALSLLPPFVSLGYEAEIDTETLFRTRFPRFIAWCKTLVRK